MTSIGPITCELCGREVSLTTRRRINRHGRTKAHPEYSCPAGGLKPKEVGRLLKTLPRFCGDADLLCHYAGGGTAPMTCHRPKLCKHRIYGDADGTYHFGVSNAGRQP